MEEEIRTLKKMLEAQRIEINALKSRLAAYESAEVETANSMAVLPRLPPDPELSKEDVAKFSRQMILPEFRARGQLALKVMDGHLLTVRYTCCIFFGGLECVGHSFAYVAHLVFLGDVWGGCEPKKLP
jgi:hypothetical protein